MSGQNLNDRPKNADACDLYATDEQEKLADTDAGMLTTELGGNLTAVVANGVRAYKNITTGENIYDNSVVAGSGIGNIKKIMGEATEEGSKAVPRIDEVEVKFNYKTKYDETEFATQLADQEAGKLTVDEYLQNRQRYIDEGRAIEGNMAQQAARKEALANKIDELLDSGMSYQEAETQANKWMESQAALHNPDQIAGGNPLNIGGMGNKGINSSIGAQWKYRIDDVDEQIQEMAKNITDAERKSTYLNVKLTY